MTFEAKKNIAVVNPLLDDDEDELAPTLPAVEAVQESPLAKEPNTSLESFENAWDASNPLMDDDQEEDELSLPLPPVEPKKEHVLPALPRKQRERKTPEAVESLISLIPVAEPLNDEDDSPFTNDELDLIYAQGQEDIADTSSENFQETWPVQSLDDELLADEEEDDDDDALQGFDLDAVLSAAIDAGASDVDLIADDGVSFSILGEMYRQPEFSSPTGTITQRLQQAIISHVLQAEFTETLELDTSYVLKKGPHKGRRTRLSVGRSFGDVFLVFRVIADKIPTPQELDITGPMLEWTKISNGLVLVCGPTGTGKSTTFASLVNEVNLTRPQKIITLEKPIEYIYDKGKAVIVQREIGKDAWSFADSLTSAMRQHPKIIMVGEVRNQVEISELLRAAESGHLAMSTMHTNSAAATINRIQGLFEGDEQKRILGSLSDNLRGIANQVLVKTKDGKSRFAVREVLSMNDEVRKYVLLGDTRAIRAYQMERNATLEHELVKAVKAGRCRPEDARAESAFPELFESLLQQPDS